MNPSDECYLGLIYIQHTFNDFKDNKIISCVDYFQERNYSQRHIYTYPYLLKYYNGTTNHFLEGIFKCVLEVSLFDERPFEHQLFLQIQKSFPLLQKLSLINRNQLFKQSNHENENLSIIKYLYLIHLNLIKIHEDYLEQFLLKTKMSLPNSIFLLTDYQLLKNVIHNITKNETRNNCAKLIDIFFINKSEFHEHLKDYFLFAKYLDYYNCLFK
ncbi:unnamed protein product [Rotaria magnacalcarata]|uniref:Uncharacterized protein n=2 Tax=Rotaria TaxID=231623 RepID=A0A820CTL4_9BILA|nr:unnamed protein product [Rotaria magnacalcarata]CAF3420550.1 unnamed protein product [Rotaria socialis]CAF3895966.1 unnamed protein product [Rotaria magnacalcarata]CAF4219862.1 unnamed protein product [Rotaria magnacalcarata]CAF4359233.1 unnamed protein product [Rotaria socialis]